MLKKMIGLVTLFGLIGCLAMTELGYAEENDLKFEQGMWTVSILPGSGFTVSEDFQNYGLGATAEYLFTDYFQAGPVAQFQFDEDFNHSEGIGAIGRLRYPTGERWSPFIGSMLFFQNIDSGPGFEEQELVIDAIVGIDFILVKHVAITGTLLWRNFMLDTPAFDDHVEFRPELTFYF